MNYKESTVTGSTWVRCRAVTITNPHESQIQVTPSGVTGYNIVPTAYFQEEQVIALPGNEYLMRDIGSCQKAFDPAAVIDLLNPTTGQPTGQTMTHGQLYAALYSLYIQTAAERDAASASG